MQRFAFFFLASLVTTLAATAPDAMRPADGTYVYTVSGVPALTSSTILVRTVGTTIVTTESANVAGSPWLAVTTYDTGTGFPVHYALTAGGTIGQIVFANGIASVPGTSETFRARAGTAGLSLGDGLIAYSIMMPWLLAHNAGAPISVLAARGGSISTFAAVPPTATRPLGVEATDAATAYQESEPGPRFDAWFNPGTHAIDAIVVSNVAIRLASYSTSTQPPIAAAAPTPYPMASPDYDSRDVAFTSPGATLSGTVSVPRGTTGRRYPAFVFVHGSGAGTRDGALPANPTFLLLSDRLSNAGYVVLRYDKRAIGKSTGIGTESWKPLGDDVRAAVAYLRTQPNVDPHRIFLLGHSEGGAIVPLIAPGFHPALAGIVMLAGPAISMPRILDEQSARIPPGKRAALDAAFRDYDGLNPTDYITKVDVPILVLQGTRDIQVLAKDLPPLIAAAHKAKRNITVRVFDGDDHLFIRVPANVRADGSEYFVPAPLDPRVADAILKWADAIP